jgi:hypothetical protein
MTHFLTAAFVLLSVANSHSDDYPYGRQTLQSQFNLRTCDSIENCAQRNMTLFYLVNGDVGYQLASVSLMSEMTWLNTDTGEITEIPVTELESSILMWSKTRDEMFAGNADELSPAEMRAYLGKLPNQISSAPPGGVPRFHSYQGSYSRHKAAKKLKRDFLSVNKQLELMKDTAGPHKIDLVVENRFFQIFRD